MLCDAIDAGKSTFVLELAQQLTGKGLAASGWVTPPHLEDGIKVGHDFVLLDRGRLTPPIPFTRSAPFEGSFPWRRFHFNSRAFAMAGRLDPSAPFFILDELGPLEFDEGAGFRDIVGQALAQAASTLTVIREGLEQTFRAFAPCRDFRFVSLPELRQLQL